MLGYLLRVLRKKTLASLFVGLILFLVLGNILYFGSSFLTSEDSYVLHLRKLNQPFNWNLAEEGSPSNLTTETATTKPIFAKLWDPSIDKIIVVPSTQTVPRQPPTHHPILARGERWFPPQSLPPPYQRPPTLLVPFLLIQYGSGSLHWPFRQ